MTTGRRSPRQERAQLTVDAVLSGTARMLVEQGFDKITTNSVAAAAGVSIGSLYQYFSNKDEIIVALIDRHCKLMNGIIERDLHQFAGAPLSEMVRGLIGTVLKAHRADKGFYRVLRSQIPRSNSFSRLDEVLDQTVRLVGMALAARSGTLRVKSPQTAAFLAVHAVDGALDAALRCGIDDPAYEDLEREAGDLVLLYLQGHLQEPASRSV